MGYKTGTARDYTGLVLQILSRSHPAHIRLVPIHARSQEKFCCPSQSLTKEEKIP